MLKDKDLLSIQECRDLISNANNAYTSFKEFTQKQIDEIVLAMSLAGRNHARRLAEMAVEETGIGNVSDKITKNTFASENVYESIKNLKTVGLLRTDSVTQIMEIGMPIGVVCGIVPTTNPTSTVIFKSLISLKAGNSIVFSPHPKAAKSIFATVNIMHEAAVKAGAPRGIIGCPQIVTAEGTRELMTHPKTVLILATGGSEMVRAAYSSGKPALGVGPGNVPAYIHRSADIQQSVNKILESKTFDNGTVCSSEQAIVVDRIISKQVAEALSQSGGYFLSNDESQRVEKILFTNRGSISPLIVGKSAQFIARTASVTIPLNTRVLISRPLGIGSEFPMSTEKLSTVLAYYEVEDSDEACRRCLKLLNLGGAGHSLVIHANDESVIQEFALKKPVSRMLVNTPSSQGAIGYSTSLTPSLTLGCGSMGGNATSDNITTTHLINIKRVARHSLHNAPRPEKQQSQDRESQSIEIDQIKTLVAQALRRIN